MSQDLIASSENLLSKITDPELKDILKDYLLEKRFLSLLPDLSDNPKLQEICKDRDEWDKIHFAAFTEHWRPDMYFSSFDKASVSFMPEDNSLEMTLLLSFEDYRCGSYNYEERSLRILKEWLWAPEGEKPWLTSWQDELILETKLSFYSLVEELFPEQKVSCFFNLLGVSDKFFENPSQVIMKKIARFQNFNYFISKAKSQKIKELYSLLYNFEIIFDPKDLEDGRTNLINYLSTLDKFSPLKINKIVNDIVKAEIKAKEIEEKNLKKKELEILSKKFSKKELEEMEKLIKLKKELNK